MSRLIGAISQLTSGIPTLVRRQLGSVAAGVRLRQALMNFATGIPVVIGCCLRAAALGNRVRGLSRYLNCPSAANGLSIFVAVCSLLFLHLESAPLPAGADIARRHANRQQYVIASVKQEATSKEDDANDKDLTAEQRIEKLLKEKIRLIEKGIAFLDKTPDYTAQFVKQELVRGELLDEQEMDLKVRHQPFSIYLKWTTGEQGREVLYVDGQNDGKMKAHGGGWKARLPAVSLELTSHLAMAESRHPITMAGLYQMAKRMLEYHHEDLEKNRVVRCEKLPDQQFDGRPCHVYLIEYRDQKSSADYRKSISMIDKEWSIPVYTRNFGWLTENVPADPEEHDTASLVEFYSYANIKFRPNLIALDFDHTNEEYRFKRQ